MEKTCPICNKNFEGYNTRKYCSPECSGIVIKRRLKAYFRKPEIRKKHLKRMRKYRDNPKVKEKMSEYNKERIQRPEIKERIREYRKERYWSNPLARKKQIEATRKYRQKKRDRKKS